MAAQEADLHQPGLLQYLAGKIAVRTAGGGGAEESGGRYLYKLSTRSETVLAELAEALRRENITYTSRIEDRQVWFHGLLNNPHKSFTYRMAWLGIYAGIAIFILSGAPLKIWQKLNEKEGEVDPAARVYFRGKTDYEIDKR